MIVKSKLQRVLEREMHIAHELSDVNKKGDKRSFALMIEDEIINAFNEARSNGEEFIEVKFELSDEDRRVLSR